MARSIAPDDASWFEGRYERSPSSVLSIVGGWIFASGIRRKSFLQISPDVGMNEDLARLVHQRPLVVGILLFPEVEVLDFAGPFEVFSVASRLMAQTHPPFRVVTIAATPLVVTRHGLSIGAEANFSNHPVIDILVVPGGIVTAVAKDHAIIGWISRTAKLASLTSAVCTGAFLLAKAGLLDGLRVTTHWEDIKELRQQFPRLTVWENVAFVDEGSVITSAGISAGIDMSLHLVGRILGANAAIRTARQMEYRWTLQ